VVHVGGRAVTGPRSSTRVVLVEDHSLFAEALQIAVEMSGYDIRRVPMHAGRHAPTSLLAPILRTNPRVVLLDLDLGGYGNGMRLVEPLTRAGVAVVVVTASADRARWGEALWLGARRVLLKSAPLSDVLSTLRRIHDGLLVLPVEEREELLRAWHEQRTDIQELRGRLERLTHREAEVLGLLMEGQRVSDIAAGSVVSEATVRTQVKAILAKLGVSSQIAAVGAANKAHWEPPHL
jgi:two-component system nitrate/nitrite response regulator NarL